MQYSIIRISDLDNIVYRLDAEYYHPDHIALEKKLNSLDLIDVRDTNGVFDCSAFYPSIVPYYNFKNIGTPFLRVNEIQNGLLHLTQDTVFLPHEILNENKTTIAKCMPGDLIIAKGGNSLAKVALLTDDYQLYSVCRDVIVLRTQSLMHLNRYYLWMFLHSTIGQQLLLRTASQTGQPHLTIEALYQLEIPLYSTSFQDCFEWLYNQSQKLKKDSEIKYQQAQILLLAELGLTDLRPKHQLTYVKKYSDTQQAHRIDAEYFQPKYDEIVNAIKKYSGGWNILGNIAKLKDKNFNPEDKIEYKYIELSNIAGNGEISDCMVKEGRELPSRARRKVATGDVIISSIEGSLSSIALIQKEYDKALCSTGFHIVNSKSFNPETLLVIMKSILGQLQLKKGCSGTILTAINKDGFRNIVVPLVNEKIQTEIQKKITESFNLRKQSKHLLEYAKRAVEMAIEQDEKTAIEWLKSQIEDTEVADAH